MVDVKASLKAMLDDERSFLEGGRNNDMVNWFLFDRILHIDEDAQANQLKRWYDVTLSFDDDQRHAMDSWEVDPVYMLHDLWSRYSDKDENGLRYLMLEGEHYMIEE